MSVSRPFTVIPDEFITKNCGEIALRELGKLIRRLQHEGATFQMAKAFADEQKGVIV